MKQTEKDFLADFIAKRKEAIEMKYKEAVDQAAARASLQQKTWLETHRYEMLQGAPHDVLQKFQEKVRCGYELVGPHEKFWVETMPGFLSIPLVVPQKKLQKHAAEVRQATLDEQLNLARVQRDAALAVIEQEALQALEHFRAEQSEQSDFDAIRKLLGEAK
ncbi:hypothetical protein G9427_00010 [Escherichia coli]|uniref:hypothetical protein n=1 Tax=Escherichia coli TaxID=562 RepID=UPI001880BB46|nr:hypothetical protein [Escherichia coli]MBE8981148.1 hypothetical protein [Escherichia coli]